MSAHHHRPTLKQSNKPFKSKHATKSALKDASKGRVPRKSPKSKSAAAANNAAEARIRRRNHAKQSQLNKRASLVSATRLFAGTHGAPRIIAVIPLTEDANARQITTCLAEVLDTPSDTIPEKGVWGMRAQRFKTNFQFINVPYKHFYEALDACKVADYVVFVLSPTIEVDTWGDTLLRTLQAQGLPDVVSVIPPVPSQDSKSQSGILKSLLSFIQYFVPTQTKVFDLSAASDRLNALRTLSEGKPADVRWREGRPYLVAEEAQWQDGTLVVTGTVRGAALSANRLVHIPNYGDFQISKIFGVPSRSSANNMDVEPQLLSEANPDDADSLVSTNEPDDLHNEQTWPTEEEMQGDEATGEETSLPSASAGTTPKAVRRIPKGMSEYQASWIVEEEDSGSESSADGEGSIADEVEEMEDMVVEADAEMDYDSKSVGFEDLDDEVEAEELRKWKNREREEQTDQAFPDEIDTPQDITARTRFQRYRGLRSFRTSPWDPFENLPRDYARIFQFEDYRRTERGVRRRAELDLSAVQEGTRVNVHISGVPKEATTHFPCLVFGLLQHEHKVSVLNFTVQRNTEYDGSVRSKDPLTLCVGPRRLSVNPVYSQHTRGGGKGTNNVHKFERFLRHGVTNVATIYGPVVFGKQPCVLLRETADPQSPALVAMGSFLNPDTTRVVAKRIILSGHPFKVHKKTATIRYMFFNPDDIHYFKPIQLHTKYGRSGHIRESLGTHGYFKAHFDGPITQMDTVCMSLYKRVYPKWASLWKGSLPSVSSVSMEE